MFYLVSYDIPSTPEGDKRRAKIARYLCGLGLRVQMSVFEIEISPQALPMIEDKLNELLDPKADSVRLYPMCGTCREKVVHLGQEAVIEHSSLILW